MFLSRSHHANSESTTVDGNTAQQWVLILTIVTAFIALGFGPVQQFPWSRHLDIDRGPSDLWRGICR